MFGGLGGGIRSIVEGALRGTLDYWLPDSTCDDQDSPGSAECQQVRMRFQCSVVFKEPPH